MIDRQIDRRYRTQPLRQQELIIYLLKRKKQNTFLCTINYLEKKIYKRYKNYPEQQYLKRKLKQIQYQPKN